MRLHPTQHPQHTVCSLCVRLHLHHIACSLYVMPTSHGGCMSAPASHTTSASHDVYAPHSIMLDTFCVHRVHTKCTLQKKTTNLLMLPCNMAFTGDTWTTEVCLIGTRLPAFTRRKGRTCGWQGKRRGIRMDKHNQTHTPKS